MEKYYIEYDIIDCDIDSIPSVNHVVVPVVYLCQLANHLATIPYPVQNFILKRIQ